MADKMIAVRFDEKQIEKLEKMSDATGLDTSKLLRKLVDVAEYIPSEFSATVRKQPLDTKSLPNFRDIPVGARFRLVRFRKTLWVKTEPVKPPEANHVMYNCVTENGDRRSKVGWNAKAILEEE